MNGGTLTLKLHRDMDTDIAYVLAIEYRHDDAKTVTSFRRPRPLTSIFIEQIADFLRACLPTGSNPHVTSISDTRFRDLDVAWARTQVLAQRAHMGLQTITIRFWHIVGQVAALLNHDAADALSTLEAGSSYRRPQISSS